MSTTVHLITLQSSLLHDKISLLARTVLKHGRKTKTRPCVFLVGGAVRDSILQVPPKDIDLEIYNITVTELDTLLRSTNPQAKITRHECYGTWSLRLPEGVLNVSVPRTETYHGQHHTDVTVTLNPRLSRKRALARRDFTINAILADPLTGTLYDPYHGRDDIRSGRLRAVNPKTFTHDPLRAWRAIQLTARYAMKPNTALIQLLKRMAIQPGAHLLSRERILAECDKMFVQYAVPSLGLELARTTGLLQARASALNDLALKPRAWHKLKKNLDTLTSQATTPAQCWQTILKTLNETQRSVLIQELALPKKYWIV